MSARRPDPRRGGDRHDPETQQVHLRIPKALHAQLRGASRADDLTVAQIIRRGIRSYLAGGRGEAVGWWAATVKNGQVHAHGPSTMQAYHRLCRRVYLGEDPERAEPNP